ncbi:uncharacterized protein [Zea mays]|uniref:uncharacterized protein isoform X2 n=1 Tax=Zea mays TaxID=4577 RepID=UPI001651D52F|nr:uncharacterized protein LOC100192689 isoform X2 [Zea mays]
MEPPAWSPPREEEEEEETEIDFDEEEDPEEVEPWFTSSGSEPELEPEPEPKHPAPTPSPAPAWAEPEQQPAPVTAVEATKKGEGEDARPRWPGWPGASVFRLVVPADKVGGIIGRRGDTIKRLCDETRARVRVLDAPHGDGAFSRIVLVSAREEVEAELSPAMNAAIKIFKHINEIEDINSDGTLMAPAPEISSVRLLVPFAQALHVIGKQGVTIKSIQESTGSTVRIMDEDELLSHETMGERIVEINGASLEVLNALKLVLGLLRKFLVDHGVLHLFERKSRGNPKGSRFLYGHDPSFHAPYSRDLSQPADSLITKITRTMQIPLADVGEIIGVRGENVELIRSVSGAVVVLEKIGNGQEVRVMIEGTPSQVQTAHQLVQEALSGDRGLPSGSSYYSAEGGDGDPSLVKPPHAGPRFLHPISAIEASWDYLPWQYQEQTPRDDHRGYPTLSDYRGYLP